MAIITYATNPIDPYSISSAWGPMSPGDVGQPVNVWAWPHVSISYTGYLDNVETQSYPIIDIMGTLEGTDSLCWGLLHTFYPPSDMFGRANDPLISADALPRCQAIKPVVRSYSGAMNKVTILLWLCREFPPRGL
jgi:hypothetical protein